MYHFNEVWILNMKWEDECQEDRIIDQQLSVKSFRQRVKTIQKVTQKRRKTTSCVKGINSIQYKIN